MSIKLFISYAHKDEIFKDNLEEHLSSLKRKGVIDSWSDRDITPGEKWENEINRSILDADIILFLISSTFNNSDYCYEKEVQTAFQRHEKGEAVILPIIVRPCDWHDMPYSEFQGLPKDGRAITTWNNEDEAWLSVIEGIKKAINLLKNKKKEIIDVNPDSLNKNIEFWLNDTGVKLNHRKGDIVKLFDLYIPPDLEDYEIQSDNFFNRISASRIIDDSMNVFIFGDDQIGKTSLLKYFYKNISRNLKVLYIDLGKDKKNSNYDAILNKAMKEQYLNLSFEEFAKDKGCVLIDNIDKTDLNKKGLEGLISYIEDFNLRIIATANEEYGFIIEEHSIFDKYKKLKILGLGNKKREDLIYKWICLGQENTINEKELYKDIDYIVDNINKVLKKNIVPSRPIYVIMILQMFEAQNSMDIELTSYGHCYQQLIYSSFEGVKIKPKDYNLYINILTELAWWIFDKEKVINTRELEVFFDHYKVNYIVNYKLEEIIKKLVNCGILSENNEKFSFKYPYLFYFFTAKKIADNCNDDEDFDKHIDKLIDKLYREDYANILIFVTHHTSSKIILDKIESCLSDQYFNSQVSTLDRNSLKFINEFIKSIPKLVIEQREIQQERDKHNRNLDRLDNIEESSEDMEPNEVLSNINRVFKSIEISGQIIKSRHYNLKINEVSNLAVESIDAGLRFISYFLDISMSAKDSVINLIAENISNDPNISDNAIRKYAEKSYLFLTYSVLSMVLQKVSYSIGAKEVNQIYDKISEQKDTPAYNLIKLSIDLNFCKKIDVNFIKKMKIDFKDNIVCLRLMKEFLIHHIYMFPVDYRTKQQISDILNIPIDKQNRLEQVTKNNSVLDFESFRS